MNEEMSDMLQLVDEIIQIPFIARTAVLSENDKLKKHIGH
jgi:hypothetical protein